MNRHICFHNICQAVNAMQMPLSFVAKKIIPAKLYQFEIFVVARSLLSRKYCLCVVTLKVAKKPEVWQKNKWTRIHAKMLPDLICLVVNRGRRTWVIVWYFRNLNSCKVVDRGTVLLWMIFRLGGVEWKSLSVVVYVNSLGLINALAKNWMVFHSC